MGKSVSGQKESQLAVKEDAGESVQSAILNIDFRRGEQEDGQVQVLLSNPKTNVDVQQQGKKNNCNLKRYSIA